MVATVTVNNVNGTGKGRSKAKDKTIVAENVVYPIKSSTDYDQFVYDPRNRPIDWKHVEELVDSIDQNNLLEDFPIVVEAEKGKYNVLEGQHRLEAARYLDVPIYYKVSRKMTFADVDRVNTAQRTWNNLDYLNRWVREGRLEYIRFKHYIDTYPHVGYNHAIELCIKASSKVARRVFRNGSYMCDNMELAKRVAEAGRDFEPYVDWYGHKHFLIALRNLFQHPRYDHATMLRKVEYQSSKLRKCTDSRSYVEMLLSIYNYKGRGPALTAEGVVAPAR